MDFSKSTNTNTKSENSEDSMSDLDYFEVSMLDEIDYKINVPLFQTEQKSSMKDKELFATEEDQCTPSKTTKPLKAHRSTPEKGNAMVQPSGDANLNTRNSGDFTYRPKANKDLTEQYEQLETMVEDLHLNQSKNNKCMLQFANQFHNYGQQQQEIGQRFKKSKMVEILKKNDETLENAVQLKDFKFLRVIGRGTFGKVYLAKQAGNSKQLFAVKSIRKDILLEHDLSIESHILEKDIMLACDHPFLVNMSHLFQNDLRLYFVMPFINGCELYQTIFTEHRKLDDKTIALYAAEMAMAIGHLHAKNIAHRDLKLENILIDEQGHLRVIDYGLAKKFGPGEKSNDFLGTFLYMAPEMVKKQGHNKEIDWWAMGIILYELMFGFTPFLAPTKEERFSKISTEKILFPARSTWTVTQHHICNLIDKLLAKDPKKRIGSSSRDYLEILDHPLFKDFEISKIQRKEYEMTYKPTLNFDLTSDEQMGSDSYIPKASRDEVSKNQSKIFDKFNYHNQLSVRGAWNPVDNAKQTPQKQVRTRKTREQRHKCHLENEEISVKVLKITPVAQLDFSAALPSRNAPGFISHKKNQSLKLSAQKPQYKFTTAKKYESKFESNRNSMEFNGHHETQNTGKHIQKALQKNIREQEGAGIEFNEDFEVLGKINNGFHFFSEVSLAGIEETKQSFIGSSKW